MNQQYKPPPLFRLIWRSSDALMEDHYLEQSLQWLLKILDHFEKHNQNIFFHFFSFDKIIRNEKMHETT
jgi:hypothetical protein